MPATYEPIATTTLGSAAASITFSSIASSWTDLRVVIVSKYSAGEDNLYVRFNNDSGSNYSTTQLRGNGSAAASSRESNATGFQVGRLPDASGVFGLSTFDVFSYAGSTYKTVLSTSGNDENGTGFVYNLVSLWRSTSAINRIDFYYPGFDAGTTATLYGIKNA